MKHRILRLAATGILVTSLIASSMMVGLTFAVTDHDQPPELLGAGVEQTGLSNPRSIAQDEEDNLYVTDFSNNLIRKYSPGGDLLLQWGSPGSGNGQFADPHSIAISDNYVYVSDIFNHRVQKFTTAGVYVSQWGTGSPSSLESEFSYPGGITADLDGNIFVVDSGNHRIQKFDANGNFERQWGGYGNWPGEFINPQNITTDGQGYVYVADTGNHRIEKFTNDGVFISQWGTNGSGDGQFDNPHGVTTDSNGYVYVVDTNNHRVQKFESDGTYIAQWGMYGSGDGQLSSPRGIFATTSGLIYVVDSSNNRVQLYGYEQSVPVDTTLSGKPIELRTAAGTTVVTSSNVSADTLGTQDAEYTYPLGMLDFRLTTNKSSNTMTLIFVTDLSAEEVIVRKYQPSTNEYSTVSNATVTSVLYEGAPALQVIYELIDNGPLDTNPAVGVIDDPIGLAVINEAVDEPGLAAPGAPNAGAGSGVSAGITALVLVASVGAVLLIRFKTRHV